MAQLINFDNYKPVQKNRKESEDSSSTANYSSQKVESEFDHSFKSILNVLVQNNPNKVLFSIKEAAKILGVGEEFIRRRIKSGAIKSIYLGDKPGINITELARIITEGV